MKTVDIFPCTAGVDLFPCCVDIQGIVSTHTEVIVSMSRQSHAGLKARDAMTENEFNATMGKGYSQAMKGKTRPAHDVFDGLLRKAGDE